MCWKLLAQRAHSATRAAPASQLRKLDVPALVLMAPAENDMRKPKTGMWDYMCANLNGGMVPGGYGAFVLLVPCACMSQPHVSGTTPTAVLPQISVVMHRMVPRALC